MIRPPALLFGVPISDLTLDETLDLLDELVRVGRLEGRTHQVATVNVDFLVNAVSEPDVLAILQRADVNLADGMPVVWAPRLLGMRMRERVAGSDLVQLLVERSQRTGHHVHFFGSTPEVAEAARDLLLVRYPDARFSVDPGPAAVDPDDVADDVIDAIRAVDPDVLCVALGNPKQERFIAANSHRLGIPVMIGVGGSLDMLVGRRRRAPEWVQRIGLEWVVRALQEPARLGRRYAHDISVFVPTMLRAYTGHRRRRKGLGIEISPTGGEVGVRVAAGCRVDPESWSQAVAALERGQPLIVEVDEGATVADASVAALLGVLRVARRSGAPTLWVGDLTAVSSSLDSMGVTPGMFGLGRDWTPDVGT